MKGSRPLSEDEEGQLFSAYTGRGATRDRCMHELCVGTGMRISEACSIRVCDVVKNGKVVKTLHIRRRDTKGKSGGAHFKLHPNARQAIRAQVRFLWSHGYVSPECYLLKSLENKHGGRLTASGAYLAIIAAAKRAGIPLERIGTHSLRKTFAMRVELLALEKLRDGAIINPYEVLREMLRHDNLKSTYSYVVGNSNLVSEIIDSFPMRSFDYERQ